MFVSSISRQPSGSALMIGLGCDTPALFTMMSSRPVSLAAVHEVHHLGDIANVGHYRRSFSAVVFDACLRRLHGIRRAACQINMSARAAEFLGDCAADAAGGPCYHGRLAA